MNIISALQTSICHDLNTNRQNMPITSLILCGYSTDIFIKTYHAYPPEFISNFIENKINAYLQKNYDSYKRLHQTESCHLLNRTLLRCRGIVADLKKYKHEPEIQYFFDNLKYFLETDRLDNNFLEHKYKHDEELEDYYGEKELVY